MAAEWNSFSQLTADVTGVIGLDGLRLRGSLRRLYQPSFMLRYLCEARVLLKNFGGYATALSDRICEAAHPFARRAAAGQCAISTPPTSARRRPHATASTTRPTDCTSNCDRPSACTAGQLPSARQRAVPAALAAIYPALVPRGIRHFVTPEVLRFLGRTVPAHSRVHRRYQGEVETELKHRPEGLRLKHYIRGNWIKVYDKHGQVRRAALPGGGN